jgi:hypothetical protein
VKTREACGRTSHLAAKALEGPGQLVPGGGELLELLISLISQLLQLVSRTARRRLAAAAHAAAAHAAAHAVRHVVLQRGKLSP